MVLNCEDWIKYEQDWPANVKKREKKKEEDKRREENEQTDHDAEENWRRGRGDPSEKHNDAYGDDSKKQDKDNSQSNDDDSKGRQDDNSQTDGDDSNENKKPKTEYQKLRERYSPQEITLLRHLQRERDYTAGLEQSDGTHVSPIE